MKSTRLVGSLILLLSIVVGVAPALGRIAKRAASQRGVGLSEGPQTAPVVRTDKEGYLAGEVTVISGEGFSPFERVMLHVSHVDGTVEAGMGHDAWFVNADADGTFRTSWSVNVHDTAGANLKLEAAGSSGLSAEAAFARRGRITTDRQSYRRGERARITAEGFNPNELVTLDVNDAGQTHTPVTVVSDNNGRATAELELLADDSGAGPLTVTAVSRDSGLTANLTIPFNFFTIIDQDCRKVVNQGCPNDQPGQKDMTQMGREESDPSYYKLFWSWDETAAWTGGGNTGYACALFDGNGDSIIDVAACGQIINPAGNPNLVVQTAASPQFWKCVANSKTDRCLGAVAVSFTPGTDIQAGVASFAPVNDTGDLKTATDPFAAGAGSGYDTTLQMNISKSFLQTTVNSLNLPNAGKQHLVNVCSYPSGVGSDAGDCINSAGGGYLVIKKEVTVGDNNTDFSFTVSPVPQGQQSSYKITGTNQTKPIGLTIGTGTESVTETALSNWKLDDAFCTTADGSSTGSKNSNPFTGITGITINSGEVTTCTFQNKQLVPHIKVVKSLASYTDADGSFSITLGDTLFYKFLVTNDGFTALDSISVIDAPLDADCGGITSLAAGASMTCTTTGGHTVTLAEADAGNLINTVNVSGKPPVGADVTAKDTLTTTVGQNPKIKVVKSLDHKSPDATGPIVRGDTLYYKFVVTNNGSVTLNSFSVTDVMFTLAVDNCGGITSLAPNASMTCKTTAGHVVTTAESDAGKVVNTVNVSGTSPAGVNATGSDTLTTPVVQNGHIKVVKSLDHKTGAAGSDIVRGDTLYYKFVVTNDGNVTLNAVGVTDATFSLAVDNCGGITSLAPNASMTCKTTAGHDVTTAESDAGKVVNTVNVSGTPPAGANATGTDTLTTPVVQNAHIKVVKSLDHKTGADATGPIVRGDTLYYKFVVTNDGSVTLNSISVTDAPLAVDCGGTTSLAPGVWMTCTTTTGHVVILAEADAGQVVNTVDVSGKPPAGADVTGNDTLTTPVAQNPHLKYNLTVTSDGNVTAQIPATSDLLSGLTWTCTPNPPTSLAPDGTMTCTASKNLN